MILLIFFFLSVFCFSVDFFFSLRILVLTIYLLVIFYANLGKFLYISDYAKLRFAMISDRLQMYMLFGTILETLEDRTLCHCTVTTKYFLSHMKRSHAQQQLCSTPGDLCITRSKR